MKLYFLAPEGIDETYVTIVSEKVLLEKIGEYYYGWNDKEEYVKRTFDWAVAMSKKSAKDIETMSLARGHYYLCKSMSQVKSIKKREIRLQIEYLKEKMDELDDMNVFTEI